MEISDDDNDLPSNSWPPLKLHETAEAKGKRRDYFAKRKGAPVWSMWKMYPALRFYESLIGFHKGSLDLTGRHQERYTNLKTAWDEYILDFQKIQPTATCVLKETNIGDHVFTDQEYTFSDLPLWERFREKWRLIQFGESNVFAWTDRVLDAMHKSPEPKIQSSCIHHLPVELIQFVYELSSQEQARLLSSTSRYIRSLALPYIFGSHIPVSTRSVLVQIFECRNRETREDAFQQLQVNATAGREKYIEALNFVLSRPILIQSLTSLTLLNHWNVRQFDDTLAEGFRPADLDPGFYAPIHQAHHQFLPAATNLTDLRISALEITIDFVRVTTSLPSLNTLETFQCSLAGDVQAGALQEDFPKYERLLNLHIVFEERIGGDDRVDAWYLLPLCPNIRTLSAGGRFSRFGIALPPEELWDAINPFKTLQKFSILSLVAWQVSALGGWIRHASGIQGERIAMTHFKLQSKGPYSAMDLMVVANALSYSPDLDVCVFEGIRGDDAIPGLITIISNLLPNILALTIISSRVWPWPMWTYGSRFSSFSCLQYFGWNARFDAEILPAQIIFMEDGYPNEDKEGWQMNEVDEASYILDFDRTAAMFGAYCPSLKYVGLYMRQISALVCSIDRTTSGMEITTHEFGSRDEREVARKWNTSLLNEWWPRVHPPKNAENVINTVFVCQAVAVLRDPSKVSTMLCRPV